MMQQMMQMQAQQAEQFQQHMLAQQQQLQMLVTNLANNQNTEHRERGICDAKILQNLRTFSGATEEFHDWQRKAKNYLRCFSNKTVQLMEWAENKDFGITHQYIEEGEGGQEQIKLDIQLNAYLISHTDGQAGQLVSSASGVGFEAWRLLMKRYDPRTSESKRALMKRVINIQPAKNMQDLERTIQEWEESLRRYEKATGKELDADIKVNTIIAMCPPKLQEHLNLTTDDEDFEHVRREVIRQIEKQRSSGPVPMDVGSSEQAETWEHEEYNEGEIGAITQNTQCYRCGGYGHTANQCATPKGDNQKGKGKGQFSKGKGKGDDQKGKGKGQKGQDWKNVYSGKGGGPGYPINGACYNCGTFGHMSKDCPAKGKGKAGLSSVEAVGQEDTQDADITGFDVGAVDTWANKGNTKMDVNKWQVVKAKRNKNKDLIEINVVHSTVHHESLRCAGCGKITIDSGAAESVMPVEFLKAQPMEATSEDKKKARYIAANGDVMYNAGQKKVKFKTKDGNISSITFQATGVRKPLAAVSRIVEKGNKVVFSPSGSYIQNLATGKKVEIEQEKGTYVMNVNFMIDDSEQQQVFSGPS